jgi:hypothetical protein
MTPPRPRSSRRRAAALLALGLLAGACARDVSRSLLAPPPGSPFASSPEHALQRLEWTWTHRDTSSYRWIFSDDFQFVFAALDTAGNAWRTQPWGLDEELRSFGHIVHGGDSSQPPMSSITLALDPTFVVEPDPRPGHADLRFHRTIRTPVVLACDLASGGVIHVSGFARCFFVRGDSALVSPEARALMTVPDSALWFIDRWEDETIPSGFGSAHVTPLGARSWGALKASYL